jgi:hypothetical protein
MSTPITETNELEGAGRLDEVAQREWLCCILWNPSATGTRPIFIPSAAIEAFLPHAVHPDVTTIFLRSGAVWDIAESWEHFALNFNFDRTREWAWIAETFGLVE